MNNSVKNNCQDNFLKRYFKFDSSILFKSKYKKEQKIPEKLNMNTTELFEVFDLMLNYTDNVNPNKNFGAPHAPTSLIYGSSIDTKTAYLYKDDQNMEIFPSKQVYFFGGDGTVTTYSSILPMLKWIYDYNIIEKDKKKLSSDPKFEIVSYCNYISKSDEFSYFENHNKGIFNKQFYALGCDCINDKGYDLEKMSIKTDKCSHSNMISDKHLIKFVYLKSSKLSTFNNIEDYPNNIKNAFNNYKQKNFIEICNSKFWN